MPFGIVHSKISGLLSSGSALTSLTALPTGQPLYRMSANDMMNRLYFLSKVDVCYVDNFSIYTLHF